MTSMRQAVLAFGIAAVAMMPLTASAQGPANQDTYFTFSQPVELPGATLPAGRYLFVLADSPSNRHVVRVMSEDRQKLHATLMAIPYYSTGKPADEPQVRFMEGPETGPQAVKIWFYPGRSVGHEFIYPRAQAMRLAQRTGEPVLTTRTETQVAENVAEQDITRVDRDGTNSAVLSGNREPAATVADTQPAPAPAPAPAPVREPMRTADERREELPNTASVLPLLALIGVGALAANRLMRRRRTVKQ